MNYFQSSRIAVGLLTILVCVCDCSVKEDSVPVIISSKENHQIPHAPSKVSHERRQSYSRIDSSTTLAPPESSKCTTQGGNHTFTEIKSPLNFTVFIWDCYWRSTEMNTHGMD